MDREWQIRIDPREFALRVSAVLSNLRRAPTDRALRDRLLIKSRAGRHIAQIPYLVEEAGRLGGRLVTVMTCNHSDFSRRQAFDPTQLTHDPNLLSGAAHIVFEYAKAADLRPTLEYNVDTREFYIVVHWD